jgi:hypothetical protein
MISDVFDQQSFKQFLGDSVSERDKPWGRELRYKIERGQLEAFEQRLKATIYHHHSSFDYAEELEQLGFPQTAAILYDRRSGLPRSQDTQMGNFAEIMGSEYVQLIMGVDTTTVMPKRLNPNIDQSMKGVDILGIVQETQQPMLLLGESKCYKKFDKRSVEESHRHLSSLLLQELQRLLFFYKEILRLEDNRIAEAKLDRVSLSNPKEIVKSTLILVVNQNESRSPFSTLDLLCEKTPLPNLLATHIWIPNLSEWLPKFFQATAP